MKESSKLKNIWILNHYAVTPDLPGSTRHFEIGKRLAFKNFNVIVFASSFNRMAQKDMLNRESFSITRINSNFSWIWIKTIHYHKNDVFRILNIFSFTINLLKTSIALVRKKRLPKPDIIIGSTVHPITPLIGILLSKVFSSKFIFEIRDLWPQTFIDMGIWQPNGLVSKFFYLIENLTIRNSDYIIVLSPKTISYLAKRYNFNKDRIIHIPNGVDVSKFNFGTKENHHNDVFKVLYLGALNKTNNLAVLLESARILKEQKMEDIIIDIYGKGKEEEKLKKMKEVYKLYNVHFMGYVNKIRVPEIISEHDVLFLPTGKVYYGSENKLYEYLASGKPIIFSVWGDHNDLSKIGAGIYANPDKPSDIANAIVKLKNMSETERKNMGLKGKEFAEKQYDWNILTNKLVKVIQSIPFSKNNG